MPAPPDYGGAIDVYHKIKALYKAGCSIYLHCFQYGREAAPELNQWCKEVWYYKRKTGWRGLSITMPYIVNSRRDKALFQRLTSIDAPILFEGVHSSYYLNHPALKDRYKLIRTHNVEHEYYHQLSNRASRLLERLYFRVEAMLLKRYESRLGAANALLPLSQTDGQYFKSQYPGKQVAFVAPFHPFNQVSSLVGSGNYTLYHGNLSHPENTEVALYLTRNIIPKSKAHFIIAGRNPSPELIAECSKLDNCKLIANPQQEEMQQLIQDAHIHFMLTFQPTGMKLKLLYALYSGRHVIANRDMLQGTGLEICCTVTGSVDSVLQCIDRLQNIAFTEEDRTARITVLAQHYNNAANAKRILTFLPQNFL